MESRWLFVGEAPVRASIMAALPQTSQVDWLDGLPTEEDLGARELVVDFL